jgi:hypothetical protein
MSLLQPSERGPSQTMLLLVFLGLSALIGVVVTLLNFEAPSAMGIVALMCATSAPVTSFVNTIGRGMTKGERVRFASLGALITSIASILVTVGILYVFGGDDIFAKIEAEARGLWAELPWLAIALPFIALAAAWVAIYLGSGLFNKQAVLALEAKQKS